MRTPGMFLSAIALFGGGFLCGYVIRHVGKSEHAHAVSWHPRGQSQTHAVASPNDSRMPEVKEVAGNFAARVSVLASTSNPYKRTRALQEIADDLNAREIRAALADLKTRVVQDAPEIRLRLLSRWAEVEPDAALQYAQTLPGGSEAPGAIAAVITSWAAIDAR